MARTRDAVEALIVLDVVTTFEHEDGERLLASMRERVSALRRAVVHARGRLPVVYVNDAHGCWDGDARGLVARARSGVGGDVVAALAPAPGDRFLFKPRYSALDGTALAHVLAELAVTRLVLAGAATEMCVAQTAIHAREQDLQVTVLRDACATVRAEDERISLEYLEHVTGSVILCVEDWATRGGDRPVGAD
ncbi:MAG TPA: isochorismatase family cysteine hydrolase [Gaiellales bacterium]